MCPHLEGNPMRPNETRTITTSCSSDCGGRCLLKVRVTDGVITQIENGTSPIPGLAACPRGLAQKDVVYASDRLTQPLKRIGPRGSGQFAPMSWPEALDTVAAQLKRVRANYGNNAIFFLDQFGSVSPLHGVKKAGRRFFAMLGGCTTWWGTTSNEAAQFAAMATYGTQNTGASRDNFSHARMIILWGWNPLVTRFGSETVHYLQEARQKGARFVTVDPRYTISARTLGAEWVPIRPGSDTALLIAMAQVMIEDDVYDHGFMEKHTIGFELFRDYVMGLEDGICRNPAWAEAITGVPAAITSRLARDYASIKPAILFDSWGPGRTSFGEQYHRAAAVLSAMSGNIGITGGHAAGGPSRIPLGLLGQSLPVSEAPFPKVHITRVYDALLKGKAGGYPGDIKLLYITGSNLLNQLANTNKGAAALTKPEFIVSHELFLTPTARFADIVLPVTTTLECASIGQPWLGGPYYIYMEPAITPVTDTRTDLAIFTELAARLGLAGYNNKTDEDWLRQFVAATPAIPDYVSFRRAGIHWIELEQPWVAFRDIVAGKPGAVFPTPSGKMEIYSRKLAKLGQPEMPPIPRYIEGGENWHNPDVAQFPLQLVSPHSRARVNSTLANIPRLQKLADDTVWMHPRDAHSRNISTGDKVLVYNHRGKLTAIVKVTAEIMPGVISLDSGAWYKPDADGVDAGGCVNVLTGDQASPGGAFTCNSCLVQVRKAI
jgi:anaerobic dimethyl sulfoxide reductase subunit A